MPPTYEATDPKTGQKWTWDGKKWNPVSPPSPAVEGAKKLGRGAALGAFSGLGIPETQTPIRDLLKNFASKPGILSALDPTGGALTGAVGIGSGINQAGTDVATGAGGAARDFLSGIIPAIGVVPTEKHAPDLDQFGHGTGALVTSLLALKGGKEAAEKPIGASTVAKGGKAAVRDLLGVGERDVESFTKKAATKEEVAHQEALAKVEKAKETYAGAVSNALKKRAAASAKETAAKTKQEALASKHGPVYQRMNEMADTAREHITQMEQKVNEAESKKWGEFSERMDNAPVRMQGTVEAITDAQKNILTGESLPIFRQILNEVVKDDAAEFIDTAGGLVPKGADVPLNLARRLYTKIGRKLGGSELPRDVARALAKVGESLDNGIAESVATKGGADALRDYRKLQADWKQYRQTFSDRDSPLRKIMEAKDPSTKLGPITGETGARAIDYLGRYRNMGARPEQLGKIRALHKALKELPGGGGKAPGMPERPSLPEVPAKKTVTPQAARETMLEGKAQFYSRPPSKWELMFPPLLAYKQTLKHLMQSPSFRKWLASDKSTPVP